MLFLYTKYVFYDSQEYTLVVLRSTVPSGPGYWAYCAPGFLCFRTIRARLPESSVHYAHPRFRSRLLTLAARVTTLLHYKGKRFLYTKQKRVVMQRDHSKAQILKSLDTGLRVLGSFDGVRPARGVTELAEELGASKASIYRVLVTLERHRYVVQDPVSGRYRLGSRVMQLGQAAAAHLDLPAEARSYMVQLRDQTREEVHLAILDGKESVYIAKANGLQPVQVVSSIGDRSPAHCVSTGKVLLAHAGSELVDHMLAEGLVAYTDRTHATPSSLLRELEKVRQQGYAVNWGAWREGVRGVAAPVVDGTQQVVASIGICGPAFRLTEDMIAASIPAVVDVAARLSAHLGALEDGLDGQNK